MCSRLRSTPRPSADLNGVLFRGSQFGKADCEVSMFMKYQLFCMHKSSAMKVRTMKIFALAGLLMLTSAAVQAASLTFDNAADAAMVKIRASQFEGGFSVNGNEIQSPGFGSGTISVPEAQSPISFSGTWVDNGSSTPYDRKIYFVDPSNPASVRDILTINVTTDARSFGTISGTWESAANGSLGPVPSDADPGDVQTANGNSVGFSAPFLLGSAKSALPPGPVPTMATWISILMALALALLGGATLRRSRSRS